MSWINVLHKNFPIRLLLSPAQAWFHLTSCNSSKQRVAFSQWVCKGEKHNSLGEETKTQSPSVCPRPPSSGEDRSKSSSHPVKKNPTLHSSFPLPFLCLVSLRQKLSISASDRKNIFSSRPLSLFYGCVDLTQGFVNC